VNHFLACLADNIARKSATAGKKLPNFSTSKNSVFPSSPSRSASRPRKAYSACSEVRGGRNFVATRVNSLMSAGFACMSSKASWGER